MRGYTRARLRDAIARELGEGLRVGTEGALRDSNLVAARLRPLARLLLRRADLQPARRVASVADGASRALSSRRALTANRARTAHRALTANRALTASGRAWTRVAMRQHVYVRVAMRHARGRGDARTIAISGCVKHAAGMAS
eukprot:1964618-Prymnesium_polylepis.2